MKYFLAQIEYYEKELNSSANGDLINFNLNIKYIVSFFL